jgi:hypothetical protein
MIELLIAITIFSLFLIGIVTMMVDMYRGSRRIVLEEQMYQDLRAMTSQIIMIVEENAIDYEEYYSAATGSAFFAVDTTAVETADYDYGDYAQLFYNFGWDGPGALCNYGGDVAFDPGCVVDKTTLDSNMGQNPYDSDPINGNAFCGPTTGGCSGPLSDYSTQEQLYLINAEGDKKTILSLEPVTKTIDATDYDENALSIVWLNGNDTDANNIVDTWQIGPQFIGDGGALITDASLIGDLSTPNPVDSVYENFIPMSPLRTNIVNLKFYVSPLEDPYKAFAETLPVTGTLVQPHVTMVITVEPSATEMRNYLGPPPQKTLQTTIYSTVKDDVQSY